MLWPLRKMLSESISLYCAVVFPIQMAKQILPDHSAHINFSRHACAHSAPERLTTNTVTYSVLITPAYGTKGLYMYFSICLYLFHYMHVLWWLKLDWFTLNLM